VAEIIKQAMVAVGVGRVPTLPLLDAATAVRKMCDWAFSQNCDCTPLTDRDNGRVTLDDVGRAVREYVRRGIYDQLIVYFAGHGFNKGTNADYWLLSDAPSDGNAAINVEGSIAEARNSRIPHLVFISDACRSPAPGNVFLRMTGGQVFPLQPIAKFRTAVDRFYASLGGDAAYEIAAHEAGGEGHSLFTESILKGLTGQAASAISALQDQNPPLYVVPADRLQNFVEKDMVASVSGVHIRLRQVPDIDVQSKLPQYLARVARPPVPESFTRTASSIHAAVTGGRSIMHSIATRHNLTSFLGLAPGRILRIPEVDRLFENSYLQASEFCTPRSSDPAFSVKGAVIERVVVARGQARIERTAGDPWQHVVITADPAGVFPRSAVIRFADSDGTGTCLAVLKEFLGTVLVDEGRVTNVAYTPARGTMRWVDYQYDKDTVDQRRAFLAASVRLNLFRVGGNSARMLSEYLRGMKYFDPALGLYAAHAFARAGMSGEIESLYEQMRRGNVADLFDVAMLARKLQPPARSAPCCPMLSDGWALLEAYRASTPTLRAVSEHLIPAPWTTLTRRGLDLLSGFLERGGEDE
jgi:hypothetical protein